MNTNDTTINKRRGSTDTEIAREDDESTNRGEAGSEIADNQSLGGKAAKRGVQNNTTKKGTEADIVKPTYQISKMGFKATIPVMSYGNIQPEIELTNISMKEGIEVGMGYINGLFAKYSEQGGLKAKEATKVTVTLKSFNEPGVEVEFDPIAHEYFYKGNKLRGATTYIKQFYKDFDAKVIAKASANAWGVEAQQVEDMWKSNGDISGAFGTLLHGILEHYERHAFVGKVIQDKKSLECNYAMPKHPMLKRIIEEFIAISQVEGIVHPEVLITDVKRGYCGQADRVIVLPEEEKTCFIEDYKINVDSEKEDKNNKAKAPFDTLPSNKITKYQLQMSFYANMLEASGWTVKGLNVYVFEDVWKIFNLPVLKII